ncbi:MAG: outer membrane beta-barrel protein, partial [Elusimicrobia bacterium]|nr:outer membrane beta-barrel protein [Elusimicrobiota bacterium]
GSSPAVADSSAAATGDAGAAATDPGADVSGSTAAATDAAGTDLSNPAAPPDASGGDVSASTDTTPSDASAAPASDASSDADASSAAPADASAAASPAVQAGQKGLVALSVGFGVARPISAGKVHDVGGSGPSLGAELAYGITDEWSAAVAYDYLNLKHAVRIQPVSVEAIRILTPKSRFSPVGKIGVGEVRASGLPDSPHQLTKFGFKLAVGARWAFDPTLALEGMVSYHAVPIHGYGNDIHALNFTVAAAYRFLK